MRAFIAINFSDEVKHTIKKILIKELSLNCKVFRQVKLEHLHMTLHFLDEINDQYTDLVKRMNNILEKEKKFTMIIDKWGSFSIRGKELIWLGLEENFRVNKIASLIRSEFADINNERRPFLPHITIARDAKCKPIKSWSNFKDIVVKVEAISLMKSEYINQKLRYSEIYTKKLV